MRKTGLKKSSVQVSDLTLKNLRAKGLFQGTVGAFYTLSRRRLETQHRLWSQELPGIKPFYAVKCNPEPKLLQWLKEEDVAFDCASAREMTMVKEHAGAEGKDILFANPCKTYQDISKAHASKVNLVTADSASEMNKMYMNIYRPNVLLRIAVDDSGASCPFSSKFGLDPDAVLPVAESAYRHVIPVVGFSFHIGSGSSDRDVWKTLGNSSMEGFQAAQTNDSGYRRRVVS
jgi:ornithine decarboxylase